MNRTQEGGSENHDTDDRNGDQPPPPGRIIDPSAQSTDPPTYSLVSVLQTSHVSRGETVIIDLFFTGTGIMGRNKLYANFSYPEVLASDPGTLNISFFLDDRDDSKGVGVVEKDDLDDPSDLEWPIDPSGTVLALPNWLFWPSPTAGTAGGPLGIGEGVPNHYPSLFSELFYSGAGPIRLELNTSSEAPSGDYTVSFTFLYKSGQIVKSHRESVEFHVNSRVEKHEAKLRGIAAIGAIVAVISLIYQTGIISLIL